MPPVRALQLHLAPRRHPAPLTQIITTINILIIVRRTMSSLKVRAPNIRTM